MNEKYIKVILAELYEKKILRKEEDGYKITNEFAHKLAKNSVRFQGVTVGLLITIIDWIPNPIQIVILEYRDVLSDILEMKKMEKMLRI